MLQFMSPKNGLLKLARRMQLGLHSAELTRDDVLAITALSRETPKNWGKGKPMHAGTVATAFEKTLEWLDSAADIARRRGGFQEQEFQDLRSRVLRFRGLLSSDSAEIYDAAEILGMSLGECQMTIDSIIHESWPLFPSMYYSGKSGQSRRDLSLAEEHLDRYEGVYLCWVRREDFWLQCPLRVRYLQPAGDGLFIRCKMNFPMIDPAAGWHPRRKADNSAHWEYDGVLTVRDRHLAWNFERRLQEKGDYFQFHTTADSGIDQRSFVLSGQYLTTGQDREQSIITGDILLHKMFSAPNEPLHRSYRDVMSSSAKVLREPKEIEEAERRWTEYGKRAGGQHHGPPGANNP
jgi:hypothetical protein